jgi:uncharacterized protein involved in outer membrane biogenesis
MKKPVKILLAFVGLVVVAFIGLSIFVSTLDADKYRPKLVDAISKQTGRAVKLNGPISFSLGLSGVKVSIQDASIANAAWGSRPVMAGMGKFELGVGLLPLLTHHLSVNRLAIENADILLETNAAGQHNWEFNATDKPVAGSQPAPAAATSSPTNASLSVGELLITNSQIAIRNTSGQTGSYNIASLDLDMNGAGAEIKFKGDANGAPITLDVKTSISDLLSKAPFTFDADATFNALHFTAKGNSDLGGSKADISAYQLTAGKTTIKGDMTATWGGARPSLHGTLTSDHLDLADFKSGTSATDTDNAPATPTASAGSKRMFSDAPLPLAGLKAADADLNVSIGAFPVGKGELKQITAKLVLANGYLNLSPVKAMVGTTPLDVQLKLNASQSPAQLTLGIIGNGIDLGDVQKLGSMSPFMTGKASANIQLTGQGNSAHEIAASLGGVITVTAENGEILTGAAASISSSLASLFNPKGGNAALNCLAVRFIAKGGVLNDNGILIDSTPSTVAGSGSVNLGAETVDLTLQAKTKLVDVGGLVPAMIVAGTLSAPKYNVDAVGMVKNVVGSLLNGNADVMSSNVPDIQTAPAGQNACIYTLDHPKAATSSSVLPSTVTGKAAQKIQNLGNSLVKGLFGQ